MERLPRIRQYTDWEGRRQEEAHVKKASASRRHAHAGWGVARVNQPK